MYKRLISGVCAVVIITMPIVYYKNSRIKYDHIPLLAKIRTDSNDRKSVNDFIQNIEYYDYTDKQIDELLLAAALTGNLLLYNDIRFRFNRWTINPRDALVLCRVDKGNLKELYRYANKGEIVGDEIEPAYPNLLKRWSIVDLDINLPYDIHYNIE